MWCIRIYVDPIVSVWESQSRCKSPYHVEFSREEGRAAILGLSLVRGVILKKLAFILQRLTDRFGCFDVTLTTVHHWNVAQTQRDDTPC
jgi:hypothetical protein